MLFLFLFRFLLPPKISAKLHLVKKTDLNVGINGNSSNKMYLPPLISPFLDKFHSRSISYYFYSKIRSDLFTEFFN